MYFLYLFLVWNSFYNYYIFLVIWSFLEYLISFFSYNSFRLKVYLDWISPSLFKITISIEYLFLFQHSCFIWSKVSLFQKLLIVGSCFVYSFCHSLCVLIVEFNPFTLKVITDKKGLISAILLFPVCWLFLKFLPEVTSESFCLITFILL